MKSILASIPIAAVILGSALTAVNAQGSAMQRANIPTDQITIEDVKWSPGPATETSLGYPPCIQTMRGVVTNNSRKRLMLLSFSVRITDCLSDRSRCRIVGEEGGITRPDDLDVPSGQTRAFAVEFCFRDLPPLSPSWNRTYSWELKEASACTYSWTC